MARTADDRTGKPQQFWRFSTPDKARIQPQLAQSRATTAHARRWKLTEKIMNDDDVVNYMKTMKRHKRLKLIRLCCPWMTRIEPAVLLKLSVRCLEARKKKGKGPICVGNGKGLRYEIDAIEAFIANPD
jgi:hypothetical protein